MVMCVSEILVKILSLFLCRGGRGVSSYEMLEMAEPWLNLAGQVTAFCLLHYCLLQSLG